jgi:Tol biopolymer transport system component
LEHLENGAAHFLPDGKRIVVNGNQPGRPGRSFLVDLAGGKPQPVTPEAVRAALPSPDGKYLVGSTAGGGLSLFPVDGGPAIAIPGGVANPGYDVAQWSDDGKALYVYQAGAPPLKIYRLEVATGKTTLLRELTPTDRAGVVRIGAVVANPNGSEFAYSYLQALSVLYVISGLR